MIISCNTIVDRRDHVQYLTVSKSYSDRSDSSDIVDCSFYDIASDSISSLQIPLVKLSDLANCRSHFGHLC